MKDLKNYYSNSRVEIAELIPNNIKNILDIGCAQGNFLKLVKERTNAETWGIELEVEVGMIAKEKIDKIIFGKIEDVIDSIPDNYFDCITFNDVLEHLLDPTEVLNMVRSKLSENGTLIASVPNVRHFWNLYELIIKKDWKYRESGILDSTHLRFFTQKSLRRMFQMANYDKVDIIGLNILKPKLFFVFNFITFNYFSDTKYVNIVSIAKKKSSQ
jgi:2-polyprenyl-3-methyl-5-hydroxy-6-metoxy-1,4-benzoquinol methylase